MNDDSPYLPGIATLIGQKMGEARLRGAEMGSELHQMREQLRAAISGGVFKEAIARAAADVTAEIVDELKGIKKKGQRVRLSDPANRDARNARFADRLLSHIATGSDEEKTYGELPGDLVKTILKNRPIK